MYLIKSMLEHLTLQIKKLIKYSQLFYLYIRDSIVVSIPACHAGDRGSIPRLGVFFCSISNKSSKKIIILL